MSSPTEKINLKFYLLFMLLFLLKFFAYFVASQLIVKYKVCLEKSSESSYKLFVTLYTMIHTLSIYPSVHTQLIRLSEPFSWHKLQLRLTKIYTNTCSDVFTTVSIHSHQFIFYFLHFPIMILYHESAQIDIDYFVMFSDNC